MHKLKWIHFIGWLLELIEYGDIQLNVFVYLYVYVCCRAIKSTRDTIVINRGFCRSGDNSNYLFGQQLGIMRYGDVLFLHRDIIYLIPSRESFITRA